MRLTLLVILGTAFALSVPTVAWAEAAPPAGSKALTEILRPIEAKPDTDSVFLLEAPARSPRR